MTCDVIGIAQYHILKFKMAAMYFALCQNLKLFLVNFSPVLAPFFSSLFAALRGTRPHTVSLFLRGA